MSQGGSRKSHFTDTSCNLEKPWFFPFLCLSFLWVSYIIHTLHSVAQCEEVFSPPHQVILCDASWVLQLNVLLRSDYPTTLTSARGNTGHISQHENFGCWLRILPSTNGTPRIVLNRCVILIFLRWAFMRLGIEIGVGNGLRACDTEWLFFLRQIIFLFISFLGYKIYKYFKRN